MAWGEKLNLKSVKNIAEIEHRKSNYTLDKMQAYPENSFLLFKQQPSSKQTSSSDINLPSPPQRTANMENMITSFMAENNLTFTLVPWLVSLIKEYTIDDHINVASSRVICFEISS